MPRKKERDVTAESEIQNLPESWVSPRTPFGEYVQRVAAAYQTSRLSLSAAATLLEASPMELLAVTQLGALSDDILAALEGPPPPATTWFYIAQADNVESVRAALSALAKAKNGSPAVIVKAAMSTIDGPTPEQKINALGVDVLWHMWKKSKKYNVLGASGQRALANITGKKGKGFPMSLPQLSFLKGLLSEMADAGAIKRSSPDGDQNECDQVLDALGR